MYPSESADRPRQIDLTTVYEQPDGCIFRVI